MLELAYSNNPRYPKPGRTNPFVNVYVSELNPRGFGGQSSPILLQPPAYFEEREKIIYSVGWASEEEISLAWENRVQNYSVVSICDTGVARCQDSLVLTEPNGWLELRQAPVFTGDSRQFALIASSEGFRHVNVINRDTNQRIPITSGEMVVTEIYHWDEENHVIYFRATRVGAPGERHLYTVTDFESGRPGVVKCLSCDVKNSRGGSCGYNSFKFSKKQTYFTLTCEGPHVPQEYLFKAPGEKIATLVSNNYLSESLSRKHLPKISNLDVKIDNGKHVAKVRLYLPHDFDDSKKYPLLVNVYGGPNSQQVNDRFKLDWGTYLTTSEGVIYAVIDGRGSGYRGDDVLFSIHRNIGNPEAQDQIDVTKKLISLYSFIDASKIAIWGWSYGGKFCFSSSRALTEVPMFVAFCGSCQASDQPVPISPMLDKNHYLQIFFDMFVALQNARRVKDVPSPFQPSRSYFQWFLSSIGFRDGLFGRNAILVNRLLLTRPPKNSNEHTVLRKQSLEVTCFFFVTRNRIIFPR